MKFLQTKIIVIVICAMIIQSCNVNSSAQKTIDKNNQQFENANDSLSTLIMSSHDTGMEMFKNLQVVRSNINAIIDSLNEHSDLENNHTMSAYKERLDSASNKLTNSLSTMSDWMDKIQIDSALYNPEIRNKYLQEQYSKVLDINSNMHLSLQYSDSILRKK